MSLLRLTRARKCNGRDVLCTGTVIPMVRILMRQSSPDGTDDGLQVPCGHVSACAHSMLLLAAA